MTTDQVIIMLLVFLAAYLLGEVELDKLGKSTNVK